MPRKSFCSLRGAASQFALPQGTSASVFATDMACCCFKREGNDRHGPPTSTRPPLGGMEFETVAKADFREAMPQSASLRRISLAFSPEQFLSFLGNPTP